MDVTFCWSTEPEHAFSTLKQVITTAPVLVSPDYTNKFILNTDALNTGFGATMMADILVDFASRLLNKVEKNYSVPQLKALATV